ncbi:MAG: tRNA glutamyl-Q(34) synthetase GluQRS [Gammaproteobacteria bacterium]|nr:tRNA glutamyl-Q(34) synthetase GluQRS [Gammaproteobacteria bacterium]
MHLGSLVAALGSYLEARRHGGRWLLRMEDLDRAREQPGCATQILRTLEAFGLQWDGAVRYQHQHLEAYAAAAEHLTRAGLTFPCSCSRRELDTATGYPGTCRAGARRSGPTALRFRVPDETLTFRDGLQGCCHYDLSALGDCIVRRRDGTFAYQLAVVVDDARQGVSEVVRGADLLSSTPWQICLRRALALPEVGYAHLPLVVEPDGRKLSKSRRSVPLDPEQVGPLLYQALELLRQDPPPKLKLERGSAILDWALLHWRRERLHGVRELPISAVLGSRS